MYDKHAVSAAKEHLSNEVATTTVDAICEEYKVTPDLIKVDVEGAERLVLGGAKETALKRKTSFIIEMHSNPDLSMEENANYVLDWCKQVGYKAWYLAKKTEITSAADIKSRGRCHILLLPDSQPFPEYLKNIEQGAPFERALEVQ